MPIRPHRSSLGALKEHTSSRLELYEKVWSTPMRLLAPEFGLSDVGLAKICKKHRVPKPPVGYWARVANGQKPRRPALPPLRKGESDQVFISAKSPRPVPHHDDVEEAVVRFGSLPVPMDDGVHSGDSHPLVELAHKRLEKAKTLETGILRPRGKYCPDVAVSRGSLDRALGILNAVFGALEELGCPVKLVKGNPTVTCTTVLGEVFHLGIEEDVVRRERPPTAKQKADLKSWGSYYGKEYDYEPTGKLSLKLRNLQGTGLRQSWGDSPKKPLGGRLGEFLKALPRTVGRLRARRAEQEARRQREEEERRQRQEVRRRWAEKQAQIKGEKQNVTRLLQDADDWDRSQQLRRYIEMVQHTTEKNPASGIPDADTAGWVDWATRQADRLDPLVESPPSILDD